MLVPLSWLKEYVDIDEAPRAVADRLTFSGIEVEGIETVGAACTGIIVAEVRAVERHPNADKLSVCRVFDGARELQVVCGAPNVTAGRKYPFAPIGTAMPDGKMTIKKAKLRGVESEGMLCSAAELLLSTDHSGLMEVSNDVATGTAISAVIGPPDTVFELEITPNRPDCLSMIGIARELAAIYGKPLKIPAVQLQESAGLRAAELTRVDVQDASACPRYTARILRNIAIGPSPAWMQQRLSRAGIRAINNIVDITNYVMLECGQPLHAFDQALLAEGRIVVRRANAGEVMQTLDNVERKLDPSMLVIADGARPVALAGVMGGAGSEIRAETTDVLLESACFQSSLIRATSRKLALSSESSYRFERKVDIGGVEWASRRAAALMAAHAGATVAAGVVDAYPAPEQPRAISCRFDAIRRKSGVDAPDSVIASVFTSLGLVVRDPRDGRCSVDIPSFRGDLVAEIDLVEEFSRMHGLDKIPDLPLSAKLDAKASDRPARQAIRVRHTLAGLGLCEIMNYSLVSQQLLDLFDREGAAQRILIPNPISSDQSILRTSLVPQMVETLGRNRSHQIQAAALFEMGRVFCLGADGKPAEETRVVAGLMGPAGRSGLDTRSPVTHEEIFLHAKGVLEQLALALRLPAPVLAKSSAGWAEPGYSFAITIDGQAAGRIGIVRPDIRREWRLNEPVAVLDLPLGVLTSKLATVTAFAAIPSFPSTVRDVAMIVKDDVKHEDIVRVIRTAAPKELEQVEVFDIFRGKSIGAGKRSVAYSLTYRSESRTLTDEEANGYHEQVKKALKAALEIELREG